VAYITKLVQSKLFDGSAFYRSDFVIQFGLHGLSKKNPHGNMTVNETTFNGVVSNTRGTAALAHFDVPDCGGTEVFINLSDNPHLDAAYGGFCVFARVDPGHHSSLQTMDEIATAVKQNGNVGIRQVELI
jgi:cyclophilin family peptidyl-prolyl cis-trans isomerase